MYLSFRTRTDVYRLLIQAQCATDKYAIHMRMITFVIIGMYKPLVDSQV